MEFRKLRLAYFGQTNIQRLDPNKTVAEELLRCSSKGQWQQCQALSQSIKADKESIDALFDELASLTETVERRTRDFEEMLMGCSIEDKE